MPIDLPDACRQLLDLQHGVIARWQAPAAGLPLHVLDTQLRWGRWQSLCRGSYATFTGPPDRMGLLWAAILRAGPGTAALSHHTAAEVDRLTDRAASLIHITIPPGRRLVVSAAERHPSAPAVRTHRSPRLLQARHRSRTLPRTRVEETALDLAQQSADLDEALAWLSRACGRRLTTAAMLHEALASRPRMPWRTELSAALADIGAGAHSVLEYRYVRDAERAHGLPEARRQLRRTSDGRREYLDNVYQGYRLAVELDGQAAHPVSGRWSDIHRDNLSAASGVFTLRYGWADVTDRPCSVAAEVAAVLLSQGWTGRLTPCSPDCPSPFHDPVRFSGS